MRLRTAVQLWRGRLDEKDSVIAERAGIQRPTFSHAMHGHNVSPQTAYRVLTALEVPREEWDSLVAKDGEEDVLDSINAQLQEMNEHLERLVDALTVLIPINRSIQRVS